MGAEIFSQVTKEIERRQKLSIRGFHQFVGEQEDMNNQIMQCLWFSLLCFRYLPDEATYKRDLERAGFELQEVWSHNPIFVCNSN